MWKHLNMWTERDLEPLGRAFLHCVVWSSTIVIWVIEVQETLLQDSLYIICAFSFASIFINFCLGYCTRLVHPFVVLFLFRFVDFPYLKRPASHYTTKPMHKSYTQSSINPFFIGSFFNNCSETKFPYYVLHLPRWFIIPIINSQCYARWMGTGYLQSFYETM